MAGENEMNVSPADVEPYLRLKRNIERLKDTEASHKLGVTIMKKRSALESEILRSSFAACIGGDENCDKVFSFFGYMCLQKANEDLTDPNTRELNMHQVGDLVAENNLEVDLSSIALLAPDLCLSVKFNKLIINTPGRSYNLEPRQKEEGLVGTLLVVRCQDRATEEPIHILHGATTGSPVIVHGWAAVDRDMSITLDPVTGQNHTRTLLVFDIYGTQDTNSSSTKKYRRNINDLDYRVRESMKKKKWCSGYEFRTSDTHFHYTRFSAERKQYLLDALDQELSDAGSVTIATRDLYHHGRDSPDCLKSGDRALYDLLSESYDVQVVSAMVYEQRRHIWNEIRAVFITPVDIATGPSAHKLLLPHRLTDKNELALVHEFECGDSYYGGVDQEAVFIVSGLRISKKQSC